MGASTSELTDAQQCVLCVHFMFDRDDFIYDLVQDDYMELLNDSSDESTPSPPNSSDTSSFSSSSTSSTLSSDSSASATISSPTPHKTKRIVFSSQVPFTQLPQIEGWFRNTTAPQCVLIALLQHFNWLVSQQSGSFQSFQDTFSSSAGEELDNSAWDSFALDYNKFVAKGRHFDGYNVELISEAQRMDLKNSLDRIEFVMDDDLDRVHPRRRMRMRSNSSSASGDDCKEWSVQEKCWDDELWLGNARDSDEWLEFLERRFDEDEIHLRCIMKTDEMEPKFFIKFMNRIMCHEGAEVVFDCNKIEQVKQWDEMNQMQQMNASSSSKITTKCGAGAITTSVTEVQEKQELEAVPEEEQSETRKDTRVGEELRGKPGDLVVQMCR